MKGITRDLLYGNDWNRNGTQDADEATSAGFDRGWSAYLTVHSREMNSDPTGKPFVYLMNHDMNQLYNDLTTGLGDESADLTKFIIMYRQYGGKQQSLGSSLAAALGISGGGNSSNTPSVDGDLSSFTLDLTKSGSAGKINSIFDLVNAAVTMSMTDPNTKQQVQVVYSSPLSDLSKQRDLLPKLFAVATLTDTTVNSEIPPRININTAPAAVLGTLPFSDVDLQKILSTRPTLGSGDLLGNPIYQTPSWLLTEAQVDINVLRTLDSLITTRTQVFRVQSVGYFEGKGPAVRRSGHRFQQRPAAHHRLAQHDGPGQGLGRSNESVIVAWPPPFEGRHGC